VGSFPVGAADGVSIGRADGVGIESSVVAISVSFSAKLSFKSRWADCPLLYFRNLLKVLSKWLKVSEHAGGEQGQSIEQ
jgi:hypothetical protein